uniref:Dol-P-Glc:Glc(2)Man(9)GlcNAc(2)-PP-Dol alpha-1,2-glucosyltransferase n=1 Tax=Tetraodon nigroviridis TaxID=99883 RepID=H3CYR1_TETNG
MEKFESYIFTALLSVNFLISCLIFSRITREQRNPYMDEIFHVPQAQKYCHGKFSEMLWLLLQWDPMITTLPGLYLVTVGVVKPVAWLSGLPGSVVCSPAMLRFINLLFNCGNFYLFYLLICKLHHREKTHAASRRVLSALSLSTFPVLYFFTFLYYTDSGSTFFILFAYLMTLYGCHKTSAFLGGCSVLFRQTNIIWVAFCAGTLVAAKLDEAWKAAHVKKRDEKAPSYVPLTFGGVKKVTFFLFSSLSPVKAALFVAWPYVVVGTGFLGFVAMNNGIVVGDRTSHEVCLHFPRYHRVRRFFQALKKRPLFFLSLACVASLLVWRFTYVHSYLLADNRHFPFYVWKRIFQKHELMRFVLVPAYVFAGWNFADSFKTRSLFWHLAFWTCLLAATVPQKLLEFRYFIVPYLMYRLHLPLSSLPRLILEFLLYTAVNAATLYIFITKTFQWPDSSETQRFMW